MPTVHQCYGQTDGQTDGQTGRRTTYDSNTALALRASRGNKLFAKRFCKRFYHVEYMLKIGGGYMQIITFSQMFYHRVMHYV